MITEERLEELIEQGAKVWCICDYTYDESKPNKKIEYYDLSNEDICISPAEFRDYGLRVFNALGYWNDIRFECLFETKEDAEWYRDFGCIEKIERLMLPTWEEFIKFGENSHYGFNEIKRFDNVRFGYCCRPDGSDGSLYIDKDGETMFLTSMITKENYTLACRKCKELFLGDKNDTN